MRAANHRGERPGLSEDELAFYDALEANGSAVQVPGDQMRSGTSLTSSSKPCVATSPLTALSARTSAHLGVLVRRILRRHGYPPDKQEKATQTVLEQAEVLSEEWALA